MAVRVDSAVDAVADPNTSCGHSHNHVLTIGHSHHPSHRRTEHSAIGALGDQKTVNCLVNVNVALLTVQYLDVDVGLEGASFFDCDALI